MGNNWPQLQRILRMTSEFCLESYSFVFLIESMSCWNLLREFSNAGRTRWRQMIQSASYEMEYVWNRLKQRTKKFKVQNLSLKSRVVSLVVLMTSCRLRDRQTEPAVVLDVLDILLNYISHGGKFREVWILNTNYLSKHPRLSALRPTGESMGQFSRTSQ